MPVNKHRVDEEATGKGRYKPQKLTALNQKYTYSTHLAYTRLSIPAESTDA
jgi:hypothetical protein